ncbi:MAG: hypothetical protein ACJAS4_000392 [Bacteriovoracaceae bacterium]|jgi:hypothetical protein
MKKTRTILTILILGQISSTFAQARNSIGDLQAVKLRVNEKTVQVDVHYPNYRMGGGTPSTREIIDCFVLDILDSDHEVTLNLKKKISQEVLVAQGFNRDSQTELVPMIKGDNIVFKVLRGNLYMTTFTVSGREDKPLGDILDALMPHTRQGNSPSAVNLLYVRDCRL